MSFIRSFAPVPFVIGALLAGMPNDTRAAQTPCGGPVLDIAPYVTLTWDVVPGALSYTVEYTTDANFLTNILQIGVSGLATQTQATTLQYGTTYYWRLRSNSQVSWLTPIYTYHSICSFSTIAAPTQVPQFAPGQTAPANNSTLSSGSTLQLSWVAYGGATAYEVQWSTNPTMSSGVLTSPILTALTWQPGAMTVATSYYWRVRAHNAIGAGAWANSPIWRFDTEAVATAFTFKVFLQGPLVTTPSVSMTDGLRAGGSIPTQAPYFYLTQTSAQPPVPYIASVYPTIYAGPVGGPDIVENEFPILNASDLAVTGAQAIVDWVVVEARHGTTNAPLRSWVMLVRKDGSVVNPVGVLQANPTLYMPMKNVKFAIRHRNHLGAMTANAIDVVGTPITVDFTSTATALYGTNPTYIAGGKRALWAGDCSGDGIVSYSGANNDRDKVLSAIGGIIPTNFVDGYRSEDVNMTGRTLYTGAANDRDMILSVIGGVVPTATRTQQLP
ncbi:MAG TPA: hypothetical protein PLB89_03260 [Flavobacteriales bacterium]|nr:hypothetical protein [Flavobacteriales bacterium]